MKIALLRANACRALAAVTILLSAAAAAPAASVDLAHYPQPRVVLSLDASGGVLWWDATLWVERLLDNATPREAALRALEYEAVKLFVTRAGELPAGTTHLRVVVVFAQSGLVSGPYATRPDAGIRTLLTVEGDPRKRASFPRTWESDAQRGVFPPGLSVVPAADLLRAANAPH
jgi:hypothetical protein